MFRKIPFLSIFALIHIVASIIYYQKHGKQGDHEGWGLLATGVLVFAGVTAIIIDLILMRFIKKIHLFYLLELVLAIIGFLIFYQ